MQLAWSGLQDVGASCLRNQQRVPSIHIHQVQLDPAPRPSPSAQRSAGPSVLPCPTTATNGAWLRPSRRCTTVMAAAAAAGDAAADAAGGEAEVGIYDVEELRGIRANLDGQEPVVEYRVHWKDGSADTWELATNVSPDLVRDFDERWWQAAKKGDVDTLASMLRFSRPILSQVVDDNRRSALHFAAAIGNAKCVKLLVDAGADIDLQDREGYTPLHMASGYMHTATMAVLLEAGADPLIKDKQGRDVVMLVENLRKSLPPNMAVLQRIMALEQVSAELTDRLYEEVEPARILDERAAVSGSGMEYLVQYKDDTPDEWLAEARLAPDLVEDWAAGLERAPAAELLDVQQWGTSREYLVRWADGTPDSWEDEGRVPEELVAALQEAQPQLFHGLKGGLGKRGRRKKASAGGGKKRGGGGGDGGDDGAAAAGQQQQQQQQQPQQLPQQQQQPQAAAAAASASSGNSSSGQPGGGSGGSSHAAAGNGSGSGVGEPGAAVGSSREAVAV